MFGEKQFDYLDFQILELGSPGMGLPKFDS